MRRRLFTVAAAMRLQIFLLREQLRTIALYWRSSFGDQATGILRFPSHATNLSFEVFFCGAFRFEKRSIGAHVVVFTFWTVGQREVLGAV